MHAEGDSLPPRALLQAKQAWRAWLQARNIRAARFQQQAWSAYLAGQSGIISAPTGSGKTLAAIGGPLIQAMAVASAASASSQQGVRILWITPLRALASDTSVHLMDAIHTLLPRWRSAMRTADATAKDKSAAQKGQAQLLVTTPESLALLLSSASSSASFHSLQCVIVDEWHELLPSKRGVLLQLNLARLRQLAPRVQVWGLSATIGNLGEALGVLVRERPAASATIVQDTRTKPFDLHSLIPPPAQQLPWAGHLGLSNIGEVLQSVLAKKTSLIFTNTRAQAELWFTALASIWPLEPEDLALHHGSLGIEMRRQVEAALRQQTLRCVVATSSLDLGVDFPAVDQVIQIGGTHSVARTVQRAGRAKHRPGAPIHLTAVATQALDLCEFAATRELAQSQSYESRPPLSQCLDVLSQHAMSMALAGGFEKERLYREVRTSAAFAELTELQWQAVLDFLVQGGQALQAYPQYQRLQLDAQQRYVPASLKVARRHRLSIGTIVGQSMVSVQFLRGARLGSVEESFISRLSPGDVFNFAGRSLELFRVENLTAWVRKSKKSGTVTPVWTGALLPFSARVGQVMQRLLAASQTQPVLSQTPELQYLQPLLSLQRQRTHIPQPHELLIECIAVSGSTARKAKDSMAGHAWFVYPFAGRVVHEGLALLLAQRLSQMQRNTFAWSCNDIGLMLLPSAPLQVAHQAWQDVLAPANLEQDLSNAVNFSEIARRRFREIAQIAGLIHARLPGMSLNARQLQVSSGLLFDVLSKYDPEHVLLQTARHEAIHRDLHLDSLHALLQQLHQQTLVVRSCAQHTPFSFGLWAESLRGQLSNETWADRIQRAAKKMAQP